MTTSSPLLVEREGPVLRLILSRPHKRNAITVELAEALVSALDAAVSDDETRVVVIAAAGDIFTAGVDVRVFLQIGAGEPTPPALAQIDDKIRSFPKPLIAEVQGPAIGMGVTLLPNFDMVYAAESATFLTPFVKLGLVVEYGGSYTLPRLIGRQRANELILRGKPLDATTAAEWGLVTRVFPDDALRAAVDEIARDVAAGPASAAAACKRLLEQGEAPGLDAARGREQTELASRYGSEENAAVVNAFLNKKDA